MKSKRYNYLNRKLVLISLSGIWKNVKIENSDIEDSKTLLTKDPILRKITSLETIWY